MKDGAEGKVNVVRPGGADDTDGAEEEEGTEGKREEGCCG